jgi:hypothetical protein
VRQRFVELLGRRTPLQVEVHHQRRGHGQRDGGESTVDVVARDTGDHPTTEAVAAGGHPGGDRDRVHTEVRPQVELAAGLADAQFGAVAIDQRGRRNIQCGSVVGV